MDEFGAKIRKKIKLGRISYYEFCIEILGKLEDYVLFLHFPLGLV